MKDVYVIYFPEGDRTEMPREVISGIDIVSPKNLVNHIKTMVDEGRICDWTLKDFVEEHGHEPQTEQDCVEFLESDGYIVMKNQIL